MRMRSARQRGVVAATMLFPIAASGAQASGSLSPVDTISAPIANVAYVISYDRARAQGRAIGVEMTFTTDGSGPVLLSLPAWTPGAYEISNFARWVLGFSAVRGPNALTWDKVDFDTWRVRPQSAGPVTIRFTYSADTLDNAMAWARRDFVLVNGANIFMYPEGRPAEFPATVTVRTESDWQIATSMTPAGPRTFSASNYHDLVDMPFFIGSFDVDSVRVSDRWVRFASYPKGVVTPAARSTVLSQLSKVIAPEAAVFGEVPWPSYTVMQIVDSTFDGASGLEHQSSHVDIVAPAYIGSDFQPSLYAHEIFHSWNVKRLRPLDLSPYVYSRPQPTPWLWVSEGITDYYADLAEVRSGLISDSAFFKLTSDKVDEVDGVMPVALEDASVNTWIHPVDGSGYLYYPKGSLAGLMLDIIIRDATDNARSLDTVMRDLYQSTYKQGRGFSGDDWWNAVTRAAGGISFADFKAKYVEGRDSYPWNELLPKAGLRAMFDRAPRMGIFSQQGVNGLVVTSTEPGGSAELAGVKAGDILVSVGDIPVEDQAFGAKFRVKFGSSAEGSPLPIVVLRGGQRMPLAGRLQFAAGQMRVEVDPNATAKAARVREGILRGR